MAFTNAAKKNEVIEEGRIGNPPMKAKVNTQGTTSRKSGFPSGANSIRAPKTSDGKYEKTAGGQKKLGSLNSK